jgi:hypothetical protein
MAKAASQGAADGSGFRWSFFFSLLVLCQSYLWNMIV